MKTVNFFSLYIFLVLGVATVIFNSCGKDDEHPKDPLTYDVGVLINGVKWATRNVDKQGTFAAKPEDVGMFYQWNRKIAWTPTGDVTGWDTSVPDGDTWEKSNDPSPAGWRVPTIKDIQKLCNDSIVSQTWITVNGINGMKFTDIATGNSIFLPATGGRYSYDGTLSQYVGAVGDYWSCTAADTNGAYALGFARLDVDWTYTPRGGGLSVRPVAE